MFMQEMLTFVCEKAASESYIETDLFSALLERLVREGDEETQYLVMDVIEGLRGCDMNDAISKRFGPLVHRLIEQMSRQL